MKNLLSLIALTIFSQINTFSQVWAPLGAKWSYSDVPFWPPGVNTPRTIECVDDTLVEGKSCRIFSGTCNCDFGHTVPILYYEDEKVYYYVDSLIGFTTLYDFAAGVGETWTFIVHSSSLYDTTVFIVLEVGEEIINGDTLSFQYAKNVDEYANWQWGGKIYKNIGDNMCFYPQHAVADPWTGPIRCYEDSSTMIKFVDIPCDTSIFYDEINENRLEDLISFFPNPASSFITITTPQGEPALEVTIYNHLGQKVLTAKPVNNEVDVSGLKAGGYFLEVKLNNNLLRTNLIII